MKLKLTALILFVTMLISSSCVGEFNNKHAGALRMSAGLLESSCQDKEANYSSYYFDIKNVYDMLSLKYTNSFVAYVPKTYTAKNPMLISEETIADRYISFIERYPDLEIEHIEREAAADEISDLYFEMLRFETQKCSFSGLAKIEHKDVRVLMDAQAYCREVAGNLNCENSVAVDSFELQENYMKLCLAKNKRRHSCLESFAISLRSSSSLETMSLWIKELTSENEDYFKLKANASRFTCKQGKNEKVIMKIDVFSEELSSNELRSLLKFSQNIWTSDKLEIKFQVVKQVKSDTVVIELIDKNISYVPHSNTNSIYLSRHLDKKQSRLVLAHEFGHVLGFPDCYMEFYSNSSKELVYYELDHEKNLMCAVGSYHTIPSDYFAQLKEKSCNWD